MADAQVSSDYIGWVSLSVDRMVRRWKKQRNNHGLLVTVTDPNQIPWDAPKLFVIMDCASGNTSAYRHRFCCSRYYFPLLPLFSLVSLSSVDTYTL